MKKHFGLITFIFLILGILVGIYFPNNVSNFTFIGTYYVKFLKLIIAPVLFLSISSCIYKTSDKKSKLLTKTIITFVIMFVSTFLLTSLIVYIIDPKVISVDSSWQEATAVFNLKDMLINLIPKNLNDIFISPKVFGIIVFSFIVGKLLSLLKADKIYQGIETCKKYIYLVLEYFMYITPIAVFALISSVIAQKGATLLGDGLIYIGMAYLCSAIAMVIIMILPASVIGKVPALDYIKKVSRIWSLTLSTRSSAATLPYTVKVCKEEFGIDEEVTDVVVPLGCTIHMCGGAVSFALLGLYTAKMYGVEINLMTYLMMIISSLLINMAAPGIPNGGVVIGATYLELLGIPLGFIGFYQGIYTLLDMIYTTLNVTGDVTANIILNKK